MVNEFETKLGTKRLPMHIELETAKEIITRGLKYYVGDKAQWLKEYDGVANWLQDNNRNGLLLYGSNGRGKSLLCRDIIPTIISYYYPRVKLYNTRAADLHFAKPNSDDYYIMRSADVIFIDDFGVENITNSYGEKRDMFSDVTDIVEHMSKLLVCSTNLTPKEIEERYGLRTLDRLHAITKPICFIGESLRGK